MLHFAKVFFTRGVMKLKREAPIRAKLITKSILRGSKTS